MFYFKSIPPLKIFFFINFFSQCFRLYRSTEKMCRNTTLLFRPFFEKFCFVFSLNTSMFLEFNLRTSCGNKNELSFKEVMLSCVPIIFFFISVIQLLEYTKIYLFCLWIFGCFYFSVIMNKNFLNILVHVLWRS